MVSVALDPGERMPRPYFVKGAVGRADHEDPSRCRASAALDPEGWILEPCFVKGADRRADHECDADAGLRAMGAGCR